MSESFKNIRYHTFSPSGTTQQKVVSFADYLFLSTFPHARQDLGSVAKSN